MERELLEKVVASLRDTAAKAGEIRTVERPAGPMTGYDRHAMEPQIVEAYSRDWIAGRLLGMADTIEALCPD